MKERTVLLNQLQQLVFLVFPEFTRAVKTIYSRTTLYKLKKYTTPARIAGARPEELGEEMRQLSTSNFRIRTVG